jgi:septum formation protein
MPTSYSLITLRLPLVLASLSPRRRDLLTEAGFAFEIVTAPDLHEAHDPELSPAELTLFNARLKARATAEVRPEALVLGADTLVYLGSEPLGKPVDLDEAFSMLQRLVGRCHTVCTGVCLMWAGGAEMETFHVLTEVEFRPLSDAEIRRYLSLINPLDKAGSYAAQEHGEVIIASTTGSWTNVVGLPMEATTAALQRWI